MSLDFGGLQVIGNTTGVTASTAAKYTQGWTVLGATPHGDLSAVPDATNSKITLTEGNWLVKFNAQVQQNGTSGTSTAGVVEEISFQAYLDAVAQDGALAVLTENQLDVVQTVAFETVITVAHGATGDLDLRVSSTTPGGSDITIREANFIVVRL